MANPFEQFGQSEAGTPATNPFAQFDQVSEQPPAPQPVQPEEEPSAIGGLVDWASETLTGQERTTPELEGLSLIGDAPELNELSLGAFKSSLGLLLSGNPEEQRKILQKNIPDANFRQDEKGNLIAQLPSGEYAVQKPGATLPDAARFVFDTLVYGPAGKAGKTAGALQRMTRVGAQSGATAALIEKAQESLGGEFNEEEIMIASALGGAGQSLEEVVSAVDRYRRAKVPEDVQRVIQRGEEERVPVMTTDVVEPETFVGKIARSMGEQVPIAGTGGKRATQQRTREELIGELREQTPDEPDYKELYEHLKGSFKQDMKAAGEVMEDVKIKMQPFGGISTDKTIEAIDREIEWLTKEGRVVDEESVAQFQKYKDKIIEGQDFEILDLNRTKFRKDVKGGRDSLPDDSKAAAERVYNAMSKDLRQSVSDNVSPEEAARWWKSKGIYAEEFNVLKNTKLKNILDKGDVKPEKIRESIMSKDRSEREELYKRLTPEGRSSARVALLSNILDKATKPASGLTPNSLATEINKHKKQIDTFFKGQDKAQLEGLQELLNATRRAQEAPVSTPTGQQLIGYLGAGSLLGDQALQTILGGGAVGLMARAYESKPVRDALVKIRSVRGDARDTAIREAIDEIQAAVQAARE